MESLVANVLKTNIKERGGSEFLKDLIPVLKYKFSPKLFQPPMLLSNGLLGTNLKAEGSSCGRGRNHDTLPGTAIGGEPLVTQYWGGGAQDTFSY